MAETIFAAPILDVADPERALALSYAPRTARAGLAALWALDETLGGILRGGRDPMVSQLRLTWWYEALCRLDQAPPPAQPLLQALAAEILPRGITGAELAAMIDGWEALLDPDPLGDNAIAAYAEARGGGLFRAAGRVFGSPTDALVAAGQGWALVDLARHCGNPVLAARALLLARSPLDTALARPWHRQARPLGMLACLARRDAARTQTPLSQQGSPLRLARMLAHALTGR
ncbi:MULTISPECIES: squalene/phytoene synthase family protein [unclassified Sphingomonas]|uniref:squalene/phytoene synthase family protein n=1 Tax=unclassified Sphingomonas TaxID=196159 RepID=UPI000BC43813|nr:MAG: hypothetical protein B7Y98_09715 [Sphingomonas sp. 32-62-10]